MYLERMVATQLDTWTNGPSLPSGIPAPRVAVRPTTLATRVLNNPQLPHLAFGIRNPEAHSTQPFPPRALKGTEPRD